MDRHERSTEASGAEALENVARPAGGLGGAYQGDAGGVEELSQADRRDEDFGRTVHVGRPSTCSDLKTLRAQPEVSEAPTRATLEAWKNSRRRTGETRTSAEPFTSAGPARVRRCGCAAARWCRRQSCPRDW